MYFNFDSEENLQINKCIDIELCKKKKTIRSQNERMYQICRNVANVIQL